jgi:predicted AAA+ superfamily ATPase
MKRNIEQILIDWKNQNQRKPLLLQGARQVGKTYTLENFGREHYANYIILDFARNSELNSLFEPNLDPPRILQDIELYFDIDISTENTLIIFDEIQLCPNALTSLKYFYEDFPEKHICASGSLLGIGLSETNFPVGKVQREFMHPMSFYEFMEGIGETRLAQALKAVEQNSLISDLIHEKATGLLKEYLIVGGLPEVVGIYADNRDNLNIAYQRVRKLQHELVLSYLDDIAKHSGKLKAIRIAALFKNIPNQLAKENKNSRKFIFKGVLPNNSNYENLEGPIEWLSQAGLIHRVPICNNARLPLSAYTKANHFVLYLFDVGILGAMLELDPAVLRNFNFGQFKGFFAENFALLEFMTTEIRTIYSWREKTAEIEFILSIGEEIIPVEVKSGLNTKAKRLQVFKEKYKTKTSLLLSGLPKDHKENKTLCLPLYLASVFPSITAGHKLES